jgi:hypothetical protein
VTGEVNYATTQKVEFVCDSKVKTRRFCVRSVLESNEGWKDVQPVVFV